MLKKTTSIPVPAGAHGRSRSGSSSEVGETVLSLEPGESFFVESGAEKQSVVQRRITVQITQMRTSGKIPFFCVTRQVIETVEEGDTVRVGVRGVRVWRREPGDADILDTLPASPDSHAGVLS